MTDKIRIGGFFSGIGSHISACDRLKDRADFEYVFQCEFDAKTALAHDTIHGQIPNLGDITTVHDIGGDLQVDILYWTPPCIRKGDRALTSEGYIPIEDIREGDMVMSHDGQWHKVTWAGKTGHKAIMHIRASGQPEIGATPEHRFYTCKIVNGSLTEPEWVMAKDLTASHFLGRPVQKMDGELRDPGAVIKGGFYWLPIVGLEFPFIIKDDVYDLTVEDAHSFIVNGVVVHNCQDISNAGKQQGNAKGSGTRSSLAYEVPRILANTPESDRPKYLVMEEVPMMISDKFRKNFDLLLAELTALGYRHRYGILNAADCGVAQSRRRCFCISKLGATPPDLPKPIPLDKCLRDYLEPEPVAPEYYLSEDRLKGLIWSNEKEADKGFGYRFEAVTEERERARTITSHAGSRKTDNYLKVREFDEA